MRPGRVWLRWRPPHRESRLESFCDLRNWILIHGPGIEIGPRDVDSIELEILRHLLDCRSVVRVPDPLRQNAAAVHPEALVGPGVLRQTNPCRERLAEQRR